MTSHCSAIQDPRFEREKTGKEYTFQFLISFLTQHIAGLSELLAAKVTISDKMKSQNIVSIDRYKETRDNVKHENRPDTAVSKPAMHTVSRSQ